MPKNSISVLALLGTFLASRSDRLEMPSHHLTFALIDLESSARYRSFCDALAPEHRPQQRS